MTEKTDRMVADAKLERIEELDREVQELLTEIDKKTERMNQLLDEVGELLE